MFSLVILVRGVGGKLSRLVYLALCPGFGSGSVVSQFLLHHYLGIFSCKRYKHYFSQTEMFTSNVQFGYPCQRGGGQLSRLVYLAPRPGFELRHCSVNLIAILENLVVRVVNIFSQTEMFTTKFSSVILVLGVGGKGILPPPPPPRILSSVNSYCTN